MLSLPRLPALAAFCVPAVLVVACSGSKAPIGSTDDGGAPRGSSGRVDDPSDRNAVGADVVVWADFSDERTPNENQSRTGGSVGAVSFVSVPVPKSCGVEDYGGCTVRRRAQCTSTCGEGLVCAFDHACAPRCQRAADVCFNGCKTTACQVLRSGRAYCEPPTVSLGTVTVSGRGESLSQVAPFSSAWPVARSGGLQRVVIEGAANGVGPLTLEATAPERLELRKPLADAAAVAFDRRADFRIVADLVVEWVPGTASAVNLQVTGPGGTAACRFDDRAGTGTVTAAALRSVMGAASAASTASGAAGASSGGSTGGSNGGSTGAGDSAVRGVQLSIERTVQVDATPTVLKDGAPDAKRTSRATLTLSNGIYDAVCRAPESACFGRCVRLSADPEHCGSCGRRCRGDETCRNGGCASLNETSPRPVPPTPGPMPSSEVCESCTKSRCVAELAECTRNDACEAYVGCITACGRSSTCVSGCAQRYPEGRERAEPLNGCACSGCAAECNALCAAR
jgi:hypothetical protein